MSWLTDLRTAVASASAAESGGLLTYRDTGTYQAGEWGIYGLILPERPDEAVALSAYVVDEGVETVVGVQFRLRSPSEARLDAVEDSLSHSWWNRPSGNLDGVELILSGWSSGASLGQDGNGRITRSANYYLTVHRPLRNRT